jgi:hypothetical protein
MHARKKYARYCAGMLAALSVVVQAHAEDDALKEPGIQRALSAMDNASTWYHPDLFGEFAGMRHYSRHEYKQALKYFEIGALYADKLSQLCLGLMYLNGEGTSKDPLTAYAWIDLAAERNYPDFVATRDTLKTKLTPEQLEQAMALRGKLAEKYGDTVAKHRLIVQLRQGQMQLTGSHTGFDYGNYWIKTNPNCGPALVVGGQEQPQIGCGGSVFAKVRWDPDLYFASRDREYKATVNVGAVQELGKAIDKPPQQSEAAPSTTPDPNANPVQH